MAKKTKRELEVFHFWVEQEQPPVDALLDEFERRHPSIKVRRNALEWSIYSMTTKARFARGNPPDVMVDDIGQRMKESARRGQLTEVTDLWKKEKFSNALPKWSKKVCSLNGKTYGIPSKCFTFVVWYLRDVFEKYGVSPPSTWDEFLGICNRIKRKGMAPIVASGWEVSLWFENILARMVGPKFYNELMVNKRSWTDAKVLDSFELLRELSEKCFHPYPFGFSFREAWTKLNDHEAAMQLQGDWVNGMWQHKYRYRPGEEYDYFLVPKMDSGQVMVMGGNVWVIPRQCAHPEEAKTFMKYAGSLEAHEVLAKAGTGIVAREDVPGSCYDRISGRLKNELQKNPTVLQMGSVLPSWMTSVLELQLIQILSDPGLSRSKVRKLVGEIETVAKKPSSPKV